MFLDHVTMARLDLLARHHVLRNPNMRADAILTPGTGLWFSRQLESIVPTVYRTKTPPRNGLRLFGLDPTTAGEGHKSYTHRMYESLGKASWINNYGDSLNRVSVAGKELNRPIKTFGSAYSYTIEDIMAARLTSMPLDAELARACRIANEEFLNDVLWFGDHEVGIWGVLSHPFIPRLVLAEPLTAAASSSDAIIATVNEFLNSIDEVTETTAMAGVLLLPPAAYDYIADTPRSATTDTTILEFLIKKRSDAGMPLRVEKVWELAGAGTGGVDVIIAYPMDGRVVKHVVPIPFRQLPVQEVNLEYVINCISKSGGFYTPYPLEMAIGELPA